MILKLKRTPGIYLLGFIKAGKSTIGRHLADRLGWNFFDTDAEMERAENAAVLDLFAARGEAEFRRMENSVIARQVRFVELGRPAVLALGDGAFTKPENRELLANNGITIWLDCPFEKVQHRLTGPLTREPGTFAALYQARRQHYSLADVHVPIASDEPEITVAAILSHPLFK